MNSKQFKRAKSYCVGGNPYVLVGTAIAGVIALISLWADDIPPFSPQGLIVVIICVLLGGGLYMVGHVSTKKAFKSCVEQLQKRGILDAVVNDLSNGQLMYDGKFLIGQGCFAVKGYGRIYLISDVERLYLTDPSEREDGCVFLQLESVGGGGQSFGDVPRRKLELAKQAIAAFAQRKMMLSGGMNTNMNMNPNAVNLNKPM